MPAGDAWTTAWASQSKEGETKQRPGEKEAGTTGTRVVGAEDLAMAAGGAWSTAESQSEATKLLVLLPTPVSSSNATMSNRSSVAESSGIRRDGATARRKRSRDNEDSCCW